MADGDLTLKIEKPLAERLEAAAAAEGKSVEVYAVERLAELVSDTDWDEIDRICDEAAAGAGSPLDFSEVKPWLEGWGRKDGPPRPR